MEGSSSKKHQYYSDKYKTTDFVWAQSLGEGKLKPYLNELPSKDDDIKSNLASLFKNQSW